jgi:hypothetical protein
MEETVDLLRLQEKDNMEVCGMLEAPLQQHSAW